MKRNDRLPELLSSSTSAPRISDGIRSGVNWMRLASSPSVIPRVSTSLVLARPGTPISSAWPPDRIVTRVFSITRSWPKMTVEIASFAARIWPATCSAERTIASSSFSTPSAPAMSISLNRFTTPRLRRHATNLMLNRCKGPVFAELNYPHIIGIWGYERHHDMARMLFPLTPSGRAPIVPDRAAEALRQTMAKQGQTSEQGHQAQNLESKDLQGKGRENTGLEGLTA